MPIRDVKVKEVDIPSSLLIEKTPNRYGAQGILNDTCDVCCCHMVPLFEPCSGCTALEDTKRQPTLVGNALWRGTADDRMRESHAALSGTRLAPRDVDDRVERALEDDDLDHEETADHDY